MRRELPWIAWIATGITPQHRGHRLFEVGFLGASCWFAAHILNEHKEQQ